MGERRYGWVAQKERDPRDLKYGVNFVAPAKKPPPAYTFGHESKWSWPVYDQNGYSTCVFNSLAFIVGMQTHLNPDLFAKLDIDSIDPQEARLIDAVGAMQGCDPMQYGCSIHDCANAAQKIGVRAKVDGKWVRIPIGRYATVSTPDEVAMAIWGHNALVHIGISVHQRLEQLTATDDEILAWDPNDPVEGGHGIAVYGYEWDGWIAQVRNSWGNWGNEGDCWLGAEALFGGPEWKHDVAGEWLAYMPPAKGLVLAD